MTCARNLAAKDHGFARDSSDPYCVMFLNDYLAGKTEVQYKTLNPDWSNGSIAITREEATENERIGSDDWDTMSKFVDADGNPISPKGKLTPPLVVILPPADFLLNVCRLLCTAVRMPPPYYGAPNSHR